jgi:hypothetical protein
VICCVAAAFLFGLVVRTVQTLLRRGDRDRTPSHPTPVRRVEDRPADDDRVPVGTGA